LADEKGDRKTKREGLGSPPGRTKKPGKWAGCRQALPTILGADVRKDGWARIEE